MTFIRSKATYLNPDTPAIMEERHACSSRLPHGDPQREAIPAEKLQLFRDRIQDRLFELVATELFDQEANGKTSIDQVAIRLGRDPVEFDRLLATPSDWTLADFSDVCLVLFGAELDIGLAPLADTAVDDADTSGSPRLN